MSAKVQIIFHFNKKNAMKVTFLHIIFLFRANLLVVGGRDIIRDAGCQKCFIRDAGDQKHKKTKTDIRKQLAIIYF
jgi:hypothetical protein